MSNEQLSPDQRLRIESYEWTDAEFFIDPDKDLGIMIGDLDDNKLTYLTPTEALQLRDWLNEVCREQPTNPQVIAMPELDKQLVYVVDRDNKAASSPRPALANAEPAGTLSL